MRYDDSIVARFDNAQQRHLRDLIRFAIGRAWYRRGDMARAAATLARVSPDGPADSLARRCRELLL